MRRLRDLLGGSGHDRDDASDSGEPPPLPGLRRVPGIDNLFVPERGPRVFVGIGLRAYPSDTALEAWCHTSPFRFLAYPITTDPASPWTGRRKRLQAMGWSLAVTYRGREPSGDTPRLGGVGAAIEAMSLAEREGFVHGTAIYGDLGAWSDLTTKNGIVDYAIGWCQTFLDKGAYSPGIYCHREQAEEIAPCLASLYRSMVRADRPRFWVWGGSPQQFYPYVPPSACGLPYADVWQDPVANSELTFGDVRLGPVYDHAATRPDPSAPEKILEP